MSNPSYRSKHRVQQSSIENDPLITRANSYVSSSSDTAVKRQALQYIKDVIIRPRLTAAADENLGRHLLSIAFILRPTTAMVKDATVVKLYLEVYHLVVTLLYIAVVSGSVSGEEVKESEIWNHAEDANGALKHLVKDQHEVHYADVDQLKSHEYIIGKFLKENLRAAVGKPQDVAKLGMAVKQLNALVGDATMTSAARDARQKVIESSITKCLDDKFHQHVVFHYLVIVVSALNWICY